MVDHNNSAIIGRPVYQRQNSSLNKYQYTGYIWYTVSLYHLGADRCALLWNKFCRHTDGNGDVSGETTFASGFG